jgi:Helix-turn-helix domain
MEKISDINRFKQQQNIILEGFDPVSASGFTQIPNFIINNKNLSASAKLVYAKLLSYAWNNNYVYPGQETMAEETGIGKRSIVRFIAELENLGFLEVQRRGLGLTNRYILRHTVKRAKK